MAEHAEERDLDQLRELVLAAFEVARQKGKSNWREMSLAVLKNRLIQSSAGRFDERDYGFRNISDLAEALPEVLERLETESKTVVLKARDEDAVEAAVRVSGDQTRIRADLWNGIMDYSAGHGWAWESGAVVPADDDAKPSLLLPTISVGELQDLRSNFKSGLEGQSLSLADQRQVSDWYEHQSGTSALPKVLRGLWNEQLKVTVIDRLTTFFARLGIEPPFDMLEVTVTGRQNQKVDQKNSLRELAQACVTAMSDAELSQLQFPAAVIVRVLSGHPELLRKRYQ